MQIQPNQKSARAGFTLAEIVICFAIMAITIAGILQSYNHSSIFAERAGYSLAAQAQAVAVMERVHAALWDTQSTPPVDTTTNIPTVTINLLELPVSGTNAIYATNTLVISTITAGSPPSSFKMIQVTTTWPWNGNVCSNQMIAYRAPDQ